MRVTRAGLAEPVMDVERLTMVYPDVAAISRDLKVIGARNATAARARGLTGKGRWRAMAAAYETQRRAGQLPATYEVVYGAAWGARGRAAVPASHGEVQIPVHAIRRRRESHSRWRACSSPAPTPGWARPWSPGSSCARSPPRVFAWRS